MLWSDFIKASEGANPLTKVDLFGVAVNPPSCSCGGGLSEIAMSEEDNRLWTGLVSTRNWTRRWGVFGPKWGTILCAYSRLLHPGVADLLFKTLRPGTSLCERCWLEFVKSVSRVAIERSVLLGPSTSDFLMDLGVLGGYDTVLNRDDPMATLKADFGEVSSASEDPELLVAIERVVSEISLRPTRSTFLDFVSFRDAWSISGVSNLGTPLAVSINGKKPRTYKSKFFSGVSLTNDQVVEECLSKKQNYVKAFLKRDEPAKARTVQAYDTRSFVRCAYLDEAFADYNGRSRWTTVGLGPADMHRARRELMSQLERSDTTAVCTDQSGFDINQPMWAVKACIRALVEHAARALPDGSAVAAAELESLETLLVGDGDNWFPWRKGVLSGHRWTALMDSVLNRAASEVACRRAGLTVEFGLWQGDDAVMVVAGNHGPEIRDLLSVEYAKWGMSVNPLKTWVAPRSCEYLHMIYQADSGKVYGYPARLAKSVLWRKPALGSRAGGCAQWNELVDTLRKCVSRGLVVLPSLERLRAQHGMSKFQFSNWLQTPIVRGGFGAGRGGRVGAEIDSLNLDKLKVKILTPYPGLPVSPELAGPILAGRIDASGFALPGVRRTVRLVNLRPIEEIPRRLAYSGGKAGSIERAWNWRSALGGLAAYRKKLRVEGQLIKGGQISKEDVPRGALHVLPQSKFSRAYRFVERWGGWSPNLSTVWDTGESLAEWGKLTSQMWAGLVSIFCFSSRVVVDGAEFTRSDMALMRSMCGEWVLSRARKPARSLDVGW